MELLALVLINIVFGVILYYAVSIKVTNSVRDYQIVKLKKEIQAHTLSFFKESESYLALMDSRIAVLKNLLQKADAMGIDFQSIQEQEKPTPKSYTSEVEEKINSKPNNYKYEMSQEEYPRKESKPKQIPKPNVTPKIQQEEDGFLNGIITGLGKGLKSMFGVPDITFSNPEREPISKTGKNSVIDVSIGGNPLDSNEVINDNLKSNDSFQVALNQVNKAYPQNSKPEDKISISIATALEELSADASKVEKVVFLLKKGYSHSDISDEMGLAIPEISLIETIKIERSRRI
ncbi:MAG: hypothetical protein IPL26_07235 [Leptospiraceae bacterium]|nr:hypothetical protein [Leptospiraceae bacterium]